MSMPPLLSQAAEDALHRDRLLSVEQMVFKRITKRLLAPDSILTLPNDALPTPPPDRDGPEADNETMESSKTQRARIRDSFRQDMLLDFAALEGSMLRLQLLYNSNERERQRYAEEKVKIQKAAQAVQDNTSELRVRLAEAQSTLERRKKYDILTKEITNNRSLRPREEQEVQLAKLTGEIEELQEESRQYAQTWLERREQFGRIVEEGRQMLKLIRDEKEEAERKEGMGETEQEDGDEQAKRDSSRMGTPVPEEGNSTPAHRLDDAGAASPRRKHPLSDTLLAVDADSRPPSRAGSRAPSPGRSPRNEDGQDLEMAESHNRSASHAGSDDEDSDGLEEGEAEEDSPPEKMDMT